MGERLQKLAAVLAVALGAGAVLAGASVFVEAWQASQAWAGSPEAQHASVPGEAPLWLDEPAPSISIEPPAPAVPATPRATIASVPMTQPRLRAPDRDEAAAAARAPVPGPRVLPDLPDLPALLDPSAQADSLAPTAPVLAAPTDIELAEVDFRFLDPPEPGAHARLAVSLVNRASVPTAPLSVVVPARWLRDFQVFGAIPSVLDDRPRGSDERQFVFAGLAPGERQTVELHLLAVAEEVDAPEVRMLLGDDAEIGRVRPRTVAPRPRPGPARVVSIPKLGVNASVVPVPWEPPPFVVGQLQGTSAVSEGNTVLIGHLAGPAGDVFARLDRLRLGDDVVAISRGLEYRFVVSEILARPYDDVMPTQPTATARLTLMTCTGQWSITRQDYSHRLWVVAEPAELAQQTIRANAERAAQAAREIELAAAARATHEAEVAEAAPTPSSAESGPNLTPVAAPIDVAAVSTPVAAAPPERASAVAPPEAAPDAANDLAPGIAIDLPVPRAAVGRRLTVRGRRFAEADPAAPLWLLVRAEVAGSRWYALDRPLEPDGGGLWQAEVELGGPPGIRHEIHVGVVDVAADRGLRRHAAERAGQPLDALPEGFRSGAWVVVERR